MSGLIGKKIGMTRIFLESGAAVSCTVVQAGPCPVVQIKTEESDGYSAVQVGFGAQKAKRATKAVVGHAAKVGLESAPAILREFEIGDGEELEVGAALTVEIFDVGDAVKITGTTKGRGFQGVVKRHGFKGRPATHGHPMSRIPGSLGPGTDPSRVIKGKKLPGRMGGKRHTIANQEIVKVDPERNLLFIKGSVPGAKNSYVLIRK
jgi:large subunit ribosomal protein L3